MSLSKNMSCAGKPSTCADTVLFASQQCSIHVDLLLRGTTHNLVGLHWSKAACTPWSAPNLPWHDIDLSGKPCIQREKRASVSFSATRCVELEFCRGSSELLSSKSSQSHRMPRYCDLGLLYNHVLLKQIRIVWESEFTPSRNLLFLRC